MTLSVVLCWGAAMAQTPPAPLDFAVGVAQSDQYEIQAARVALTESSNPQVRDFAQQMVEDHSHTTDALRKAVAASGLPQPPAAMSSDQAALLAALQSLRGADFDKAYVKQQLLAHDQALAVEKSFADHGTDKNLVQFARMTMPLIQQHLEMARQIAAMTSKP